MKGLIFDIQRFSVHDGPGIRTAVFMKGCPLRCAWCHNPEGLERRRQLQFFAEQCIGCGSCGKRDTLSDAALCPSGALAVCGQEMDADEVFSKILRDSIYYADDGGVTFSGGECLLQADFVAAVLKRAKDAGIHTAIDTSGAVLWSEIEKTLDVCDLYLYDIKCMDSDRHKKFTGADNARILDNLRRLDGCGKPLWIRTPVIPDFNDSAAEMTAIADFAASLSFVSQVTLMPYHTLGASKYETLGYAYPYDSTKRVSAEQVSAFEDIFRRRGLHLV